MENNRKFKLAVVIACLVWANTFVFILYLSVTNRTETTLKQLARVKSKVTQQELEDLVELTDSTKNYNYVGNINK